jgi:DNA polymerase I-like protein with 3'-5' exonuclease and polymerase domains
MINIDEIMREDLTFQMAMDGKMQPVAYMINQIHDELMFEVHEKHLDKFKEMVKVQMENPNPIKLKVKTPVKIRIGKNWSDLE